MPWFFALEHPHYSRWLPVHIRDMKLLPSKHPNVYEHFKKGGFAFNKTTNSFSALSIDHNHEQHNAVLKGDGGIIGITDNPSALLRWMVAGPEIAKIIRAFESEFMSASSKKSLHHEQNLSTQTRFLKEVVTLIESFLANGNPFEEDCSDPITLKSKIIFDENSYKSIRNCKSIGTKQYNAFVKERFVDKTINIMATISGNSLPLFRDIEKKKRSKSAAKIKLLQSDCALFSRLFIAAQNRPGGEVNEFFKNENQPFPPSISESGSIRSGSKSDILSPLESLDQSIVNVEPSTTCAILDGPPIVYMVKKQTSKTFGEYAQERFVPYLKRHFENQRRIDLIFDIYKEDSLKAHLRQDRESGMRQKVQANIHLPKNWETFLRVDENKTELFKFLSNKTVEEFSDENQIIICTVGENCISNKTADLSNVSPSDHEEADSRMMVHLKDAVFQGHCKILIRTVDSDVVILATRAYDSFECLTELWVAFGTGKNFRYIAAHQIANALGPERTYVLPFFHGFTGCDVISFYFGRGKKTFWDIWMSENYLEFTKCFKRLIDNRTFDDDDLHTIEKFVIQSYDRSCGIKVVNEARKYLFATKMRPMDSIPPTQNALMEHIKRTIFQTSLIWRRSSEKILSPPDPTEYGWTKVSDVYEPYWTSMPEISESCQDMTSCGCVKGGCIGKGKCKCKDKGLPCTLLCKCQMACRKSKE